MELLEVYHEILRNIYGSKLRMEGDLGRYPSAWRGLSWGTVLK